MTGRSVPRDDLHNRTPSGDETEFTEGPPDIASNGVPWLLFDASTHLDAQKRKAFTTPNNPTTVLVVASPMAAVPDKNPTRIPATTATSNTIAKATYKIGRWAPTLTYMALWGPPARSAPWPTAKALLRARNLAVDRRTPGR